MWRIRIIFLLGIFCSTAELHAQSALSGMMEIFTDLYPDQIPDPESWQQWQMMLDNPIPLNRCEKSDLTRIPGIDGELAKEIIRHRSLSGLYLSTLELQSLDGMNPPLYRWLLLFIVLEEPKGSRGAAKWELISLWQPTMQKRAGTLNGDFIGVPLKQYHRLRLNRARGFIASLALDQDAGEAFRWNSQQKGFDFYSGYLGYRSNHLQLILGDYRAQLGQGLLIGNYSGFGSALWVAGSFKSSRFMPYSGKDEQYFFRGVAAQWNTGNWKHQAMISHRKVDGNAQQEAYSVTGLHRTMAEREKRGRATQQIAAYSIHYSGDEINLGINLMMHDQGAPRASVDYQFRKHNAFYFGEIATDISHWSMLHSGVFNLSNQMELSFLYRRYSVQALSPYSSASGTFSRNENEQGITFKTTIRLKHWILNAYNDLAYRAHPSYLHQQAYWRQQSFIQASRNLGGVDVHLRWVETRGVKEVVQEAAKTKTAATEQLQKWRLDIQKGIDDWKLHFRFEQCQYHCQQSCRGSLGFMDIRWKPEKLPFSIHLRYTQFKIDNYAARIYTYEPDVLYAYSVPAFQGVGQKALLVLKYRGGRLGDVYLKSSWLIRSDQKTYGSGYDLLSANYLWEFKFMYRKTF